jgi:hypothetical protein
VVSLPSFDEPEPPFGAAAPFVSSAAGRVQIMLIWHLFGRRT